MKSKETYFYLIVFSALLALAHFAEAAGSLGYNTFNAGNLTAKVSNSGLIGDTMNVLPSGWWPAGSNNSYFRAAGLWLGGSNDGGIRHSVSTAFPEEFFPTTGCSSVVSSVPGTFASQELWAKYDDANSQYNTGTILNTQVTFRGYQWSLSPANRFFITEYWIKNTGTKTLTDFYVGYYCDPNVVTTPTNSTNTANNADYDRTLDDSTGLARNLVWVTADSALAHGLLGFPAGYLGLRMLETRDPNGVLKDMASVKKWGGTSDPKTDSDPADRYNRYGYLSSPITDVDANTIYSDLKMTTDPMNIQINSVLLKDVIGVYSADDTLHLGTNYYQGGNFNNSGWIQFGTPVPNKLQFINNDQAIDEWLLDGTGDSLIAIHVMNGPLDSVAGIWHYDDTLHTGINYYTGGSDSSNGWIYLGTKMYWWDLWYWPFASYYYKTPNIAVAYTYRYWNEYSNPADLDHVQVSMTTNFDEVEGVYLAVDTLHEGTNYYAGGSFDKGTGVVTLGSSLPSTDPVWICYHTYTTNDYKTLLNSGPFTLNPGDSVKAVYATVVGQTLQEVQSSSDLAQYLWNNHSFAADTANGSITGTVTRTDTTVPLNGALVKLYQGGSLIDSTFTTTDGRYGFVDKPAGVYDSVTATLDKFTDSLVSGITVLGGTETGGVNIRLKYQYGQVKGRIVFTDGVTPIEGVSLYLRNPYSGIFANTLPDGSYLFDELPGANYDTLFVALTGFTPDSAFDMNAFADSIIKVDFQLKYLFGRIAGKITQSDGASPIANAVIRIDSMNAVGLATGTTDVDGNYDVRSLTAGSYRVQVTALGYDSSWANGINVKADSISQTDLSLNQSLANGTMRWVNKASMTSPRYGLGVAEAGGKIYLIGGRDYNGAMDKVEEYNYLADTVGGNPWTTLAPMPTSRYGFGCAVMGDTIIYAVGGYDNLGNPLNVLEAYKPATDSWVTGLSAMPTERAFLGAGVVRDSLFAFGGENRNYTGLDTVEVYLSASNTWVTKKALLGGPSFGRRGAVCATPDSNGIVRAYSIGGQKADGTYLTANQKYNPATNAWVARSSITVPPRAFMSADVIYDSIYCLGGQDASLYYNYVSSYNPYANNWKSESAMIDPRAYSGCGAIEGDGIYVFGGKTSEAVLLNTVEKGYRFGSVSGTATTTMGDTLQGMQVEVQQNGSTKYAAIVSRTGYYSVTGMEPGVYNLRFSGGAYDDTITGISVQWGKNTLLDFKGISGKPGEFVSPLFALHQSYPNPLKRQTQIEYQIPSSDLVSLAVYNVLGQQVKILVSGKQSAGRHSVVWKGDDQSGRKVASGIYFYKLTTSGNMAVKKMLVVK